MRSLHPINRLDWRPLLLLVQFRPLASAERSQSIVLLQRTEQQNHCLFTGKFRKRPVERSGQKLAFFFPLLDRILSRPLGLNQPLDLIAFFLLRLSSPAAGRGGMAEACCGPVFWLYLIVCLCLVLFAGLMSGLTLGLMSLSLVDLEVIAKAGQPEDKRNASPYPSSLYLYL